MRTTYVQSSRAARHVRATPAPRNDCQTIFHFYLRPLVLMTTKTTFIKVANPPPPVVRPRKLFHKSCTKMHQNAPLFRFFPLCDRSTGRLGSPHPREAG